MAMKTLYALTTSSATHGYAATQFQEMALNNGGSPPPVAFSMASQAFSIWSFRGGNWGNRKISWWVILVRLNWLSFSMYPRHFSTEPGTPKILQWLGEIFIPMTTKSSKYWDLYSISFLRQCQVFTNEVKRFLLHPQLEYSSKYIKIIAIYHGIYESLWIDILLCGMISDIDRHLWDCLWSSHVIP